MFCNGNMRLLTVTSCYNLCPSNPQVGTAQGTETSWCNAASQYVPQYLSRHQGGPRYFVGDEINQPCYHQPSWLEHN
jgi:hypothetical protein